MEFKFCPKCGEKLEWLEEHGTKRQGCSACGFVFYQNSKPTASAIIVKGDKVLLAKRKIEPEKGQWDIPGGFLENGEAPEAGLYREIVEETGLEIEIFGMLGIFMDTYGRNGVSTMNLAYLVKIKSGEPIANDDVEELKWFSRGEIPFDDMAFENGRQMLKAWLNKK